MTERFKVEEFYNATIQQVSRLIGDRVKDYKIIEDGKVLFNCETKIATYVNFIKLMHNKGVDLSSVQFVYIVSGEEWNYKYKRYVDLDDGKKLMTNIGLDKMVKGICSCLKWLSDNQGLDMSRYEIEFIYKDNIEVDEPDENISDVQKLISKLKKNFNKVIIHNDSLIEVNEFKFKYGKDKVEIPYGVNIIGDKCFRFTCIKEVKIPDSVYSIGNEAFFECNYLESIKLPKNLLVLGHAAFFACISLKEITIPSLVTTMGSDCFAKGRGLKKVVFQEGIKIIPDGFAYSGNHIEEVYLPKSIETIGNEAFGATIVDKIMYAGSENDKKNIIYGDDLKDVEWSCNVKF